MQSIIINNIGPIKHLEYDLTKQINIVIGEQSIGKSTLMKSIYYAKSFITVFFSAMIDNDDSKDFNALLLKINATMTLRLHNLLNSKITDNSSIVADYGFGYRIETLTNVGKVEFHYSQKLLDYLQGVYLEVVKNQKIIQNSDVTEKKHLYWIEFVKGNLSLRRELKEEASLYIPAERSVVNLLTSIKNRADYINRFDLTVTSFADAVDDFRYSFLGEEVNYFDKNKFAFKNYCSLVEQYCKDILKGRYVFKNQQDFLELDSSVSIPLQHSSSGQQEAVWILNVLNMFLYRGRQVCYIIEEPEANLFPATQKKILELIVLIAKITHSQVFITTHSPYMLTSLNLLLYAGKHSNYADNIDEILHLNDNLVSAMYMKLHDTINILQDGEIDASYIDEVSNVIYGEIDKIMARVPLDEVKDDLS